MLIIILIIIMAFIYVIFFKKTKKKSVEAITIKAITEVLLSVPYEKVGGKDWCLPASAVMVFGYYSKDISQALIANKVIVNGNASTFRLVSYAKELGFFSSRKRLSIKEIEGYLQDNIPLIVIQKYSTSISNSHCRVIIGFDSVKAELTLHDPAGRSNYKITYKAFFNLGFDNSEVSQIIIIGE